MEPAEASLVPLSDAEVRVVVETALQRHGTAMARC
jgi:hypothetical protein